MDEILEEQIDTGSDTVETIETGDDETPDNSQDTGSESEEEKAKRNKSNWKKVSEKAKQAEKLEKELELARAELNAWRTENPDLIKETLQSPSTEKLEKKLFIIENPDAKEHLDRIDSIVAKSKGGIDREEAWELIKPTISKESVSKSDFSTKSAPITSKKDITKLSPGEALDLKGNDYIKWAKANGFM